MRSVQQRAVCCAGTVAAAVVLGLPTVPASAARKPITGKLSRPGYTLMALATDGSQTSVRATRSPFRLRVRSASVTLHLRGRDGRYAGPVVIRGEGRHAVMGVRAGTRLGTITVGRGYARLSRRLARRYVDARLRARARRSVPIGARVFGRVRTTPQRNPATDDRDLDGIPDQLDIDDDGDLILDKDERARARGRIAQTGSETQFFNGAALIVSLEDTVNFNAGSTDAQIDAALPRFGWLGFSILSPDAELDCATPQARTNAALGGLTYCSRGGTGKAGLPGTNAPPFPACCDADNDGMGTMVPGPNPPVPGEPSGMFLAHGATTAQIGTGDLIIERFTRAGAPAELSAMLQYVFATTPALISYSDAGGTPNTSISYPAPPAPLPVRANAQGEVLATLTFWRPQRRPIAADPPSPSGWIDIGGLLYTATNSDGRPCPGAALSSSDPNLRLVDGFQGNPGASFQDTAPNLAAVAASNNRFAYRLNLTRCLASKGLSFNVGDTRPFTLLGGNADTQDNAGQQLFFMRTA
jgi:hypothetical protein